MRIFVAIPLTEEMRTRLMMEVERAKSMLPAGVRWVPYENIHLTLIFLGEQPASKIPAVKAVIQRSALIQSPFDLGIREIGSHPDLRRPRVFWIGVEETTGRLKSLQRALEEGFATMGIRPEGRPFHPHLTIARVKREVTKREQEQMRAFPTVMGRVDLGCARMNEIVLYRSDLRPQGAIYSRVQSFPLGGQP
ncbi:MAG: RNA 2',3'-cyclic phosphodiesterase [Anaerolineales bacterium]|nr:RNA 2',3'-cyclic phosphodiesterase [Anaerolineales bacterium]